MAIRSFSFVASLGETYLALQSWKKNFSVIYFELVYIRQFYSWTAHGSKRMFFSVKCANYSPNSKRFFMTINDWMKSEQLFCASCITISVSLFCTVTVWQ